MIVHRWQAPQIPTEEQILQIMHSEGFDAQIEVLNGRTEIKDHRHHLSETLVISQGELVLNISGNQIILRQGDRAEIPPNTKHAYRVNNDHLCRIIVSYHV